MIIFGLFIFGKLGSFLMAKTIYNRLKAVLAEKGEKNKELAEHLGIANSTVSRWATNDAQPSIETLFKIADFLKVDVRTLLVSNLKE